MPDRLHPVIDRVFLFEEAIAAYRHLEAGASKRNVENGISRQERKERQETPTRR